MNPKNQAIILPKPRVYEMIAKVNLKYNGEYHQQIIDSIMAYVSSKETIVYQEILPFIASHRSRKMGGIRAIQISQIDGYLRELIKQEKRRLKKIGKLERTNKKIDHTDARTRTISFSTVGFQLYSICQKM